MLFLGGWGHPSRFIRVGLIIGRVCAVEGLQTLYAHLQGELSMLNWVEWGRSVSVIAWRLLNLRGELALLLFLSRRRIWSWWKHTWQQLFVTWLSKLHIYTTLYIQFAWHNSHMESLIVVLIRWWCEEKMAMERTHCARRTCKYLWCVCVCVCVWWCRHVT